MKFQASLMLEAPIHEYVRIFGPVENRGDVIVTQACASADHLKMLCGTLQSRMDRAGRTFTGAVIQEHGTEPPDDTEAYKVVGPLKVRMDYRRRPPYAPMMNELDPPNQGYYEPKTAAVTLEHPDTVIIPPNEWYPEGLTEQQVANYYDRVKPLLVKQYQDLNAEGLVVMKTDGTPIVRRNSFNVQAMDLKNPEAIDKLNRGRTVEFHFALGKTTKVVWVDLDPNPEFPFEDVKFIALDLQDAMQEILGSGGGPMKGVKTEIRFSGRSGFHILHYLAQEMDADDARVSMKNFVGGYIQRVKMYRGDDRLTEKVTKDPKQMRLDYSTLHDRGGLRSSYSLAFPTGLICLPIPTNQVMMFKKEDATINATSTKFPVQTSEIADIAVLAEIKDMNAIGEVFLAWMAEKKLPEDLNQLDELHDLTVKSPEALSGITLFLKQYTGKEDLTKWQVAGMLADMLSKRLYGKRLLQAAKFEEQLAEYKQKRDFGQTPEPAGATEETTEPVFVIQQHDAHKAGLHYDFRLAQEGVLKSWAVPKLMDLISGTKDVVLAVETEPHPIEYAKFEGSSLVVARGEWPCIHALEALGAIPEVFSSIPSGYGAGEVKIWDGGNYETTNQDADHWKFTLDGNRLKGSFTLIRTAGNKWILRRNEHGS